MKKQRLKRLYAPYVKEGKRWYRAGFSVPVESIGTAKMIRKVLFKPLFKQQAIARYQRWLMAPFMGEVPYEKRELRPIPLNSPEYERYSLDEYKIGKD